jgi:DNA modification methylase
MNRSCQRQTQGFDTPARRITSTVPQPSTVARMIRARQTCFCGLFRSATIRSSRSRSVALTSMLIPSRMPQHATAPAKRDSYDCVRPLERLLALADGEAASEDAEDEVPEPPEDPVSKPGDLWVLGHHRLLCGDATVLADVERVLGGQLADMTFCDPPYNVDYANSPKDRLRGRHRPILNDSLGSGFEAFLYDACTNILAVTKGACYICMSSSELDTLQRAFRSAGGKWSTFIIWAKNTFTLGRADYQRQYEPILYGWKDGSDHYWCGARDQGDVWFVNKPVKNDLHPTMKPVALVERAIRNSSKSRDVVLDTFGGSGSTLIACQKAGRQARLIELDPRYVDVIVRRWQEFTGGTAILDGEARSYDELASGRAGAVHPA